jgi:two-component sensor histidine kinase
MIINVFYVALALAYVISRMVATNKKMNKDYEDQMKHKQILLKEIHHRVKNNLQIVSSLLRLQAAETENKIVEEEFGEAIGRIRSMALIHETMYQNDDLATLDIKSYLTSLAQDISDTIKSDTVLEINIGSEVNKVDVKYVVSLSLIFNELMTNSIKHGFSNKEKGTIDVKIINSGEKVTFSYSDDGNWKQPISDTTFGLELLETLTEQLDGNLVRTINNVTNYTLSFDNKILLFENEV